jgi:hypothetical protein
VTNYDTNKAEDFHCDDNSSNKRDYIPLKTSSQDNRALNGAQIILESMSGITTDEITIECIEKSLFSPSFGSITIPHSSIINKDIINDLNDIGYTNSISTTVKKYSSESVPPSYESSIITHNYPLTIPTTPTFLSVFSSPSSAIGNICI